MTGAQALDMVMLRLVRSDSATRAALLLEINQLLHTRLEGGAFLPWFLYREDVSVSTVASTESVALPTGFIRFEDNMETGGVFYKDTTVTLPDQWVELVRSQGNRMQRAYLDSEVGVPEVYDLRGTSLYFRPIPDDAYELKIGAMFQDANVEDGATTNLWLTHASDLIVAEATLIGSTLYTRDKDLQQIAMAERNTSMERLITAHTAFLESMQERTMGDD